MDGAAARRREMKAMIRKILRGLLLYMLFPSLCLAVLWNPVGNAVRESSGAAYWILLAALGAVAANWTVYRRIHGRWPSLLVLAHGAFCLLLTVVMETEALPGYDPLASTLSVIGGCLALTMLFMLSFWFAPRRSRIDHVVAVGLWIVIAVIAFFMAAQVIRDIEIRQVNRDTWITAVILAALIPAACIRRIIRSARGKAFRKKASSMTMGKITQLFGETHLDLDGDPVTEYYARIRYSVAEAEHEIKTGINEFTMRRFGKDNIVGLAVPVYYDPAKPAEAYASRIDRFLLKNAIGKHTGEEEQEGPDES